MPAVMCNVLGAVHQIWERGQDKGQAAADKGPDADREMLAMMSRDQNSTSSETYCVVLPVSKVVLVKPRWPQAGQSTGAAPRLRTVKGVAFLFSN